MAIYYFAYGSNMLSTRIKAASRCPGAKLVGVAVAVGYDLDFSKRSVDESGKATIWKNEKLNSSVMGVIYEIPDCELSALDRAEGATGKNPGYQRTDDFSVQMLDDGKIVSTKTYVATKREENLKPYDWYFALIAAGNLEHKIDAVYAKRYREMGYLCDGNDKRETRQDALDSLKQAGYEQWTELLSDKALPFDVRIPNAETQAAMRDIQEGKVKRFKNVEALMADLNDDED